MNFLTVKGVAALLNVKISTIYAWAEQSKIPCYKLNGALRFREEDILAWLKTCKLTAKEYNYPAGRRPRKGGME